MAFSAERSWQRPGRRSLLAVAVALPWSSRGHAQSGDPRQSVTDLYAALQSPGRGESFAQRFEQLAPVIDRAFDLNTILQTSVGLRWTSLDEASRRSLATIFRTFTVASYTANFREGGLKYEVLPQSRASGSDVVVQSRLLPSGGEPVRIDYVTRGGRIVDVLLNGSISRVAVQRSDFRALLASGSPTPLIDSLRQKVAELSDGAMRP